jgi:hypothetical protein
MNPLISGYEAAYSLLRNVTPLRSDCGELCNHACCQSGPEETGMYLFPGEEALLRRASFLHIEPSGFEYRPGKKVLFASCEGFCDRSLRPLACRIFPLAPYLTVKDLLILPIDPRAHALCPLARGKGKMELNPMFVKRVRVVSHDLFRYSEFQAFVGWLSEIVAEASRWHQVPGTARFYGSHPKNGARQTRPPKSNTVRPQRDYTATAPVRRG